MRYLGTHFSITLGGVRLRVRIDLDEVEETEERRPAAGTPQHGSEGDRRFPHHVRSRGA